MHILYSLFFFLTRTRLASHSRWYTSLIKSVAKSQVISTLMASFLSCANHHSFCLTGLAVAETFKECSIRHRRRRGWRVGKGSLAPLASSALNKYSVVWPWTWLVWDAQGWHDMQCQSHPPGSWHSRREIAWQCRTIQVAWSGRAVGMLSLEWSPK
jgi:hypothetical protein